MTDHDQMLTQAEVAKLLRVTPRTITNMVVAGRFPHPIKVGVQNRWLRSTVSDWIDSQLAAAS